MSHSKPEMHQALPLNSAFPGCVLMKELKGHSRVGFQIPHTMYYYTSCQGRLLQRRVREDKNLEH